MFERLRKLFGLGVRFSPATSAQDATELVTDAMKARAENCVRLTGGDGLSRLGGLPHLPTGIDWPRKEDRLLDFIAQIDLAEIRRGGGPEWLPEEGVLFFFYDAQEQPWGFDPADRGGWAVVIAQAAALTAMTVPDDYKAFPAKRLTATAAISHPSAERLGPALFLSEYDFDAVYDLQRQNFPEGPNHQIGGFPQPVQGDIMELEAQLACNGINVGDGKGYSSRRAKALESGAKDWRLLLQIDTDDDVEMMWGDVGTIYFWVREQDARRGDFSDTWLVLQCS